MTVQTKLAVQPREKNGRHKRPTRAEMERLRQQAIEQEERKIIGVVLDQPHRRGSRDQQCEDALGRFVIAARLDRALYDAGQEFAEMIIAHRSLCGLPGVYSNGPGQGHISDDAEIAEKVERLRRRILDAKTALRPQELHVVRWLTLEAGPHDDLDLADTTRCQSAAQGLNALAIHFGMKERRRHA